MGHIAGEEIYQQLGDKLDTLPFRVNKNSAFFNILKALYSADEAKIVVNMSYGFSSAEQVAKAAGFEKPRLENLLESLAAKGLIMDICIRDRY